MKGIFLWSTLKVNKIDFVSEFVCSHLRRQEPESMRRVCLNYESKRQLQGTDPAGRHPSVSRRNTDYIWGSLERLFRMKVEAIIHMTDSSCV